LQLREKATSQLNPQAGESTVVGTPVEAGIFRNKENKTDIITKLG